MPNKILFFPKEGTSGFGGMRDVPEEPEYCTDFGDIILVCESTFCKCKGMLRNHNAALESCKSNSLEIVNPDVLPTYEALKVSLIAEQMFDLPEGYEFKEEEKDSKKALRLQKIQ